MGMRENTSVSLVKRAFPATLINDITITETSAGAVVHVPFQSGSQNFIPIWAGEGFPRDVEAAVARLGSTLPQSDGHVVVTARCLSSGARKWLEDAGMSWTDETGDAHIEVPPGFLIVRQNEKVRSSVAHPNFRWSASTGAVAETLLVELTQATWLDSSENSRGGAAVVPRPSHIAKIVPWSPTQIAKSLQSFDRQGWTSKTGPERGTGAVRELIDPGGMLTSWAQWHQKRVIRHAGAHALWRDPEDFVREKLGSALSAGTWAVSDWLALEKIAPFTSDVPNLTCYLAEDVYDNDLVSLMSSLELRPVPSGARVTFVRAEPQVLSQRREVVGIPFVSSIRLYGDLLRAGPRGVDAAEHTRESDIGF